MYIYGLTVLTKLCKFPLARHSTYSWQTRSPYNRTVDTTVTTTTTTTTTTLLLLLKLPPPPPQTLVLLETYGAMFIS